jgi:hypothetical protein
MMTRRELLERTGVVGLAPAGGAHYRSPAQTANAEVSTPLVEIESYTRQARRVCQVKRRSGAGRGMGRR